MAANVFQNALYVGTNFTAILYGVELTLYLMTLVPFLKLRRQNLKRTDWYTLAYSAAVFVLATIFVAVQAVFGQEMWIVNANFPGGDTAYLASHYTAAYVALGRAAFVGLSLLTNGLLIRRCLVTSGDRSSAVCIWLYFGTLVLGILAIAATEAPGTSGLSLNVKSLTIAYVAILTSLNVILSLIVCYRLLFSSELAGRSASDIAAAVFVESVLPYTLAGIVFLITYLTNSPAAIFFLSLYVMSSCICPHLIILRIVNEQHSEVDRPRLSVLINTRVSVAQPGSMQFESMPDEDEDGDPPIVLQNITSSERTGFGEGKW